MRLSIVTTMYRSAPYLREFYTRMSAAAKTVSDDYEIIFVNDGSPDNALEITVGFYQADPRVRVVDLSRNFGHHKAMMTGLAHARGELVFLIDSDLEESPELISLFYVELNRTGADVVYGVQKKRKGDFIERAGGALFYTLFDFLADYKIPRNVITGRLMTRRYVDALTTHQEREIFMAGLWSITGFEQVGVPVEKHSKGDTSYTFRRRLNQLVTGVTSFSSAPLRYIFYLGATVMLLSCLSGMYLVFHVLFLGKFLPGWASVMVSVWLLGGMMIFSIGVVGIYLNRVFSETKQRPYTVVRHVYEQGANNELRKGAPVR